ncbi:MAG TPA: transcription termination/antitermination NusG family protein [Hanamia sp.]
MQKNWYIIYTKPKCEKKVAASFTKKKIENFYPVNCKQITILRRRKLHQEPLFDSYVFANIPETDIPKIKMVDGVVNLVYWKGKPATIGKDEIEVMKEFTTNHQDIKLEKTLVNLADVARVTEGPKYAMEGNLLTVKNTTIKVNLPSIGFTMIAEVIPENVLGPEVSFGNRDMILQS